MSHLVSDILQTIGFQEFVEFDANMYEASAKPSSSTTDTIKSEQDRAEIRIVSRKRPNTYTTHWLQQECQCDSKGKGKSLNKCWNSVTSIWITMNRPLAHTQHKQEFEIDYSLNVKVKSVTSQENRQCGRLPLTPHPSQSPYLPRDRLRSYSTPVTHEPSPVGATLNPKDYTCANRRTQLSPGRPLRDQRHGPGALEKQER